MRGANFSQFSILNAQFIRRRPVLSVKGLSAWYGEAQVLRGIDLDVDQGQVVTLVGRNGAGPREVCEGKRSLAARLVARASDTEEHARRVTRAAAALSS